MALSLAGATLTALFMESVLYGLYLDTFARTLAALLARRVQWPLLGVACAMFVVGTFDVAVVFKHNLDAFVRYGGPGGADERLADISDWVNPAKGVAFIVQILLGDGMLIYRCFVVYDRSWPIILLPCALWLGTATCGFALPVIEATFHGSAVITARELNVWTDAGTVLTLVTNLITTSLLAGRLYMISQRSAAVSTRPRAARGHAVRYAMRIIVESGVLYTLSTVVLAAVSFSESLAVYPVSDSILQIIGISFNLIIIRVSEHTTLDAQEGRERERTRTDIEFATPQHSQYSFDDGVGRFSSIVPGSFGVTTIAPSSIGFCEGSGGFTTAVPSLAPKKSKELADAGEI